MRSNERSRTRQIEHLACSRSVAYLKVEGAGTKTRQKICDRSKGRHTTTRDNDRFILSLYRIFLSCRRVCLSSSRVVAYCFGSAPARKVAKINLLAGSPERDNDKCNCRVFVLSHIDMRKVDDTRWHKTATIGTWEWTAGTKSFLSSYQFYHKTIILSELYQ